MSIFRRRLLFQQSYLPKWFTDSLVCWYDVGKQGASNELLKLNPILKDFSKNHLDLNLHNFAFSGMSGVGGYLTTFDDFYTIASHPERQDHEVSTYKFKIINQNVGGVGNYAYQIKEGATLKIRIKVTGLSDGNALTTSDNIFTTNKDGEFLIIDKNVLSNNRGVSFALKNVQQNANVTIEVLPEYPGGLVFDGVDDYGISENQPHVNGTIISKMDDVSCSIDTNTLKIGKIGKQDALYQFLRFNRKLTDEEINWVKTKIIGG